MSFLASVPTQDVVILSANTSAPPKVSTIFGQVSVRLQRSRMPRKRTDTCPKIEKTFGGAEVFALKMTTSWVGTDPKNDIPVPDNVRRYYLPSSTHGGGG